MSADPKKLVVNNLPEFLLLASVPAGDALAAVDVLRAVVVCYDAQDFYRNYDAVVYRAEAPDVGWDEFAAYCDSKMQPHFARPADQHRCCMTASDLIRAGPWRRLYDLVGARFMRFLLFECLLFVPIQRGAYYCVRTPSQSAGRYEVLRSFWTAAGSRKRCSAKDVGGSSARFSIAGLLRNVQPVRQPSDPDDMLREIVARANDFGISDRACFDALKRKLKVLANKDTPRALRAVYEDAVGDAVEVPLGRVKKFAAAVVRKTVPVELFGVSGNRDRYCDNLSRVLNGGMSHEFGTQHVVHGIKTGKIGWLAGVLDAGRRTEIMTATLMWLTTTFVFNRIAHYFRVATTNVPNGGVAFFTKTGWQTACREKMSPLMDNGGFFERLPLPTSTDSGAKHQSYREWKVCPYAKPGGMRLIFKSVHRENGREKQMTDDCLMFLRCLLQTYPAECRSVSKPHFLRCWKALHESRNDRSPPAYYVRTDFRDAFTSIELKKLLAVLRNRMVEVFGKKHQTVNMHSVDVVKIGDGTVYSKKRRYVEEAPVPDFPGGSLVFYQSSKAVKLIDIWDAVRKRIRRNAVLMAGRRWAVTRGIVQGDRLSVVLCDLLIADLQVARLKHLTGTDAPGDGRLFRFVDDFVYVSSDRTMARRFLATMSAGFDEYGLRLNQTKTETNWSGNGGGVFRFLGFLLNPLTGEMSKDVSAYKNRRPLHYFDYGLGRSRPGHNLYAKMTATNQRHLLPAALISKQFNSTETAARSLASAIAYRAFAVVTAIKQYFLHLNPAFVVRTIHGVAQLMYAKMFGLARYAAITPMQCKWIAYEVYTRVFHRHFSAENLHVLWILDRIRVLQIAAGRKCNTAKLRGTLKRHNFDKMFG